MADLHEQYERELRRHINRTATLIRNAYEEAIRVLSLNVQQIQLNGQVFNINDYPRLKQQIETQVRKLHSDIYTGVVNGIKTSWGLSNEKNDILVDRRLAGRRPKPRVKQILYDPNKRALNQYIARREKGLNLSDRVWKTIEPYKHELEAGLGVGITDGMDARSTARELKKYLVEPDKLFRRVRDAEGKLQLSKAAKEYHPGQGVYRSSFKNAMRLTRTENNMAYRTADSERWKKMPFVKGIQIKLSAQHPKYDICDSMVGSYPKDFLFRGWHPQCLCYAIPELMTDEEYEKYEDSLLGIADFDPEAVRYVEDPPEGFQQWVRENAERVDGWKSRPYWVKDNQRYYNQALQDGAAPVESVLKPAGMRIKEQFTKVPRSIGRTVDEALEAIDSVHGDGALQDIPFKKVRASYEAAFRYSAQGNPMDIFLSSNATHGAFSIVHEMGHYFDLHAIGEKGKFESQRGELLKPFRDAVKETAWHKHLTEIRTKGSVRVGELELPLSAAGYDYADYIFQPHEIWARAYAQFIAVRSGNTKLLDGLKARLERGKATGMPTQWAEDDFTTLEKVIEALFLQMGWISR